MKQLLFLRVNGHLFWRKRRIPVVKYFTNQYRNHCSVVKTIQEPRNDISKPILSPKKFETNRLLKRFSADFQTNNNLMNFEVWPHPSFLTAIKNTYYFLFKIKTIDQSFSIEEFLGCTNTALQVVVNLLSERRFSELEGLLTPECKEEVERNIKLWPESQISALAFKPEQVSTVAPGDITIFSDEKNKERLFVEIRLIHYIFLKSPVNIERSDLVTGLFNFLQIRNTENLYIHEIFNTKFIREYTEGVDDQWTINAINVRFFP